MDVAARHRTRPLLRALDARYLDRRTTGPCDGCAKGTRLHQGFLGEALCPGAAIPERSRGLAITRTHERGPGGPHLYQASRSQDRGWPSDRMGPQPRLEICLNGGFRARSGAEFLFVVRCCPVGEREDRGRTIPWTCSRSRATTWYRKTGLAGVIMREKYPGWYPKSAAEASALWNNAIFVPDANVLLHCLRHPAAVRERLLRLFEVLKASLWIPYQVGLEFHRNRLDVELGAQDAYEALIKDQEAVLEKARERLRQLRAHPTISVAKELAALDMFAGDFRGRMIAAQAAHPVQEIADAVA